MAYSCPTSSVRQSDRDGTVGGWSFCSVRLAAAKLQNARAERDEIAGLVA